MVIICLKKQPMGLYLINLVKDWSPGRTTLLELCQVYPVSQLVDCTQVEWGPISNFLRIKRVMYRHMCDFDCFTLTTVWATKRQRL